MENKYIYKEDKNGEHFYRKSPNGIIIHIALVKKDGIIKSISNKIKITDIESTSETIKISNITSVIKVKKNDFVINSIDEIIDENETINSTQEIFDNKIREIVSISELYNIFISK